VDGGVDVRRLAGLQDRLAAVQRNDRDILAAYRSLTTGYRAAVPAATICEALEVLYEHHVAVMRYYPRMGAAHVVLPPSVANKLFGHPLIDYIEPPPNYSLGIGIPRTQ